MEMDIVEANGNCAMQTTWHTDPDTNGGCDEGGCGVIGFIPQSGKFHMNATFDSGGTMRTFLNGEYLEDYSPTPDDEAKQTVVDTMRRVGAVLWSSQWSGWVPAGENCPGYNGQLSSSSFSVSNLMVFAPNGVVQVCVGGGWRGARVSVRSHVRRVLASPAPPARRRTQPEHARYSRSCSYGSA